MTIDGPPQHIDEAIHSVLRLRRIAAPDAERAMRCNEVYELFWFSTMVVANQFSSRSICGDDPTCYCDENCSAARSETFM